VLASPAGPQPGALRERCQVRLAPAAPAAGSSLGDPAAGEQSVLTQTRSGPEATAKASGPGAAQAGPVVRNVAVKVGAMPAG